MIDQSSDITKFFNEIIVTKDKVAKIREYYTRVKNNIIDEYDVLKITLENDIGWIQDQISSINALYSDVLTIINGFVAKTSPPHLIVEHSKYLELMALYNKYIKIFYDRMNELYDIYKENFIQSKINMINDSWKFHYSENRNDALRVQHKYQGININQRSQLLEISSGRYLLHNGENIIYDINNKTKDCFIINYDSKTINNIRNIAQGSRYGLYSGEGAQIKSIFKVKNKDSIYVLIDLGFTENASLFGQNDIVGTLDDGIPHILGIAKYDVLKKTLSFPSTQSKTSLLIIRDKLLTDDLIIHENPHNDYYYLQAGKYVVQLKIDGNISGNTDSKIVLALSNKIIDMKIFQSEYLVITLTQKVVNVYRLNETVNIASPYKSINTASLPLAIGDSGVVNAIMVANEETIYIATNKSLWYSRDLFNTLTRDDRIELIGSSNVSLKDKSNYKIDHNGILYYLHENRLLYRVEEHNVQAVSPSRYPEKLLFLENVNSLINEGYLYRNNPDLYPGENIVFSYIENTTYIGITVSGKVISGNIEDGTWNPVRNSLTGNNSVTAALIDEITNTLYLATYNGIIYTLNKSTACDEAPEVSILQASDMGSIYAMCIYKDILYMAGYIGRVGCYDLKTNTYYPYNEYSPNYITNMGTAIGNVNVRAMDIIGGSLVIAGNAGRIASCNLTTKKWTRFNGTNEYDGGNNIDSVIFNNGSALGNFDITAMYNYLGKYLIIFGINGRIASYNIYTSSWTDYTGIPLNPALPGPPIYSVGDHSNGNTVRSIANTDKGIVIGSDGGHISSLNPLTGGITRYNGIQVNINIPGPGISFDSSGFEFNILSLVFDIKRGNIIAGANHASVVTYNVNEKDLLLPNVSKLYYIAKRDTKHDYLSSLLIEISKETLFEKRIIYPPREEDTVLEYGYNTYFYVYKNGPYIYKLASNLEDLQQSVNGGKTFTNYRISNKNWGQNNKIEKIKGYVSKDGTFALYALINNISYILLAYQKDSTYHVSWYTIDTLETESIVDIGLIDSDISDHYLFYFKTYDLNRNITYPIVISINNNELKLLRNFLTSKTTQNDDTSTLLEDNIHITMNSEGKVFSSNERYLNIFAWNYRSTGLFPDGDEYPTPLIDDYTSFVRNFFITRKKKTYLKDNENDINRFIGFYTLPHNIFNLIYAGRNGNIVIITIYVQEARHISITQDEVINNDMWNILFNEIPASEYLSVYANNQAFQDIALSDITIDKSYLVLSENNIRGLLGLDISYYEKYNPIQTRYKEQHIIISLDCEVYSNHIAPEYRVYKNIIGKCVYVNYDEATRELVIANYKNKVEDYIYSITSIYKLSLIDSAPYTPLRTLTDYWYNHKVYMHHDINAIRIRTKMSQLENDSFKDIIDRQFSFRYEVLIINETTGSYILYETEKSIINSRVDSDTKTINTFLRIKAIDGFEDDIIELFNSRISGRQISFNKVQGQRDVDNSYLTKGVISYDFNTIIQLGEKNRNHSQISPSLYAIKIRPVSNIPSSIDIQFYIEPYMNAEFGVTKLKNQINRSEFKSVDFKNALEDNEFYYFASPSGFLSETMADIPHLTGSFSTSNHELYAQYDMEPVYRKNGFADTLVTFIKGRGNSRYDRIDGMVTNIGHNTWSIIPYTVNRKQITYYFDTNGTKKIQEDFNIEFLKNGRNISKMHEFGIFSPSVVNIADYYTDYKDSGRIVKHEGLMSTPYGLHEGIGTMDGRQKRITDVHEANENTLYRYTNHALDEIRNRLYGYAYDIIDHYTMYETPYYYIRAWWIPARGFINRSNESLLTVDNDEILHFDTIGQALFPFDYISPPPSISKPNKEDAGGGIGSGGMAADPNVVAFSTLILEKYPLEHWDGYDDLHFVRFYKDIYMDGHEEDRIDIEPPREVIPRNLYHYEDDLDWERRGKETLKYLTGYYYNRFDWKIYYHEVREITSGYNEADNQFIADNPDYEYLIHDYNASQLLEDVFTEEKWYVNELPEGSGTWPQPVNDIIGERIIHMTNPLVDMVIHIGSMASWNRNNDNVFQIDYSKAYFKLFRRGELFYEKVNIQDIGHNMFDVLDPVLSRKKLDIVENTVANTFAGQFENLVDRINHLNTIAGTNHRLVFLSMQDKAAINGELKNALENIGINLTAERSPGNFNHLILGSIGDINMIFHEQSPASHHSKGLGYILPIRTNKPDYDDIENLNNATPWVVTVKKYRADCHESTETRNMVLTNQGKKYDQYAGLGIHKYLYATEYKVSLLLHGINPRLHEKLFYYYTIEGIGESYYSQFSHWWDFRAPSGITNNNIVEREFISRAEPTDEYKRIVYYIREWLNDATTRDIAEHYDFFIKWVELNNESVLRIPINDEAGEYFDSYEISGIERYEFYDGTILSIPRFNSMTSLRENFGVTTVLDVTVDSTPSDPYYIRRKITFSGLKINNGGTNSFERTWSTTATYTTEDSAPDGAQKSENTGTRILKWEI